MKFKQPPNAPCENESSDEEYTTYSNILNKILTSDHIIPTVEEVLPVDEAAPTINIRPKRKTRAPEYLKDYTRGSITPLPDSSDGELDESDSDSSQSLLDISDSDGQLSEQNQEADPDTDGEDQTLEDLPKDVPDPVYNLRHREASKNK